MQIVQNSQEVLVRNRQGNFRILIAVHRDSVIFTEQAGSIGFGFGYGTGASEIKLQPNTAEKWREFNYILLDPTKPANTQIVALAKEDILVSGRPGTILYSW